MRSSSTGGKPREAAKSISSKPSSLAAGIPIPGGKDLVVIAWVLVFPLSQEGGESGKTHRMENFDKCGHAGQSYVHLICKLELSERR